MNDSEYIFNQTSRERKSASRGAFAKKNGSKSKKCTLPSDYLTPAEKKKLNGKAETYDLSKPMKWKEFTSMPHDLRAEYIKKLAGMGAGRDDLSDMFGCAAGTYSSFMSKNHKGEKFLNYKGNESRNNDAFIEWFCGETDSKAKDETNEVEEKKEDVAPEKNTVSLDMIEGSICYKGDARAIFEKVLLLLDSAKEYEIKVEFKAV